MIETKRLMQLWMYIKLFTMDNEYDNAETKLLPEIL